MDLQLMVTIWYSRGYDNKLQLDLDFEDLPKYSYD